MDESPLPGAAGGFSQGLYQPVMGTDLRIQVWAEEQAAARHGEQEVLDEVLRLAAIFTTWEPDSPLMRWRRGELEAATVPELDLVLGLAAAWFQKGGGAFHPACEVLRRRWLRAADAGIVPSRQEMQELADQTRELPWQVVEGHVRRTGDCSGADLNAFVKGWIVETALQRAVTTVGGIRRIGVNAGGDLRHHGSGTWRVGVEDPSRPSDNRADRLCTVGLTNAAIATSSLARRGFRVGGHWFGHVLDPRTGWPVEHVAQVTVVASDAGTADVLATICGVLPVDEGMDFVANRPGTEALLVTPAGRQYRSPEWEALLV